MVHYPSQIKAGRETLTLKVETDRRLRTTARWMLRGQMVLLRVPISMSHEEIQQIIAEITPRIARQRKRAVRQSDLTLMQRAQALNAQYFSGELSWHSIRWVKNMERRLGSC